MSGIRKYRSFCFTTKSQFKTSNITQFKS